MSLRRLALISALGAVVVVGALTIDSGRREAPEMVISGWSIGDRTDCSRYVCEDYIRVAREALDSGHPGHPEVVEATLHDQPGLSARTIAFAVVVFRFRQGPDRAIGVGAGIGPEDSRESPYRLFAKDLDP